MLAGDRVLAQMPTDTKIFRGGLLGWWRRHLKMNPNVQTGAAPNPKFQTSSS